MFAGFTTGTTVIGGIWSTATTEHFDITGTANITTLTMTERESTMHTGRARIVRIPVYKSSGVNIVGAARIKR